MRKEWTLRYREQAVKTDKKCTEGGRDKGDRERSQEEGEGSEHHRIGQNIIRQVKRGYDRTAPS